MAKTDVTQWDTVAANNTDINSIPIDGAVTTPSQVDNIIREMMSQIKAGISASYFIPSSPVLTLPQINDTSSTHQYVFGVAELAADRIVNLPLLAADDTFVFAAFAQTLTNKTLGTGTAFSAVPTGLDASTTAKGISEFATAAEFRTGTDTGRSLVVSEVWASAAEVTLTDAATIAVDMSTFINAVVTLGANRAMGNPTNEKVGQTGHIRIVQDATGSRTLSYGTDWEFAGGIAPVLSTAANAQDLLFYRVIATDRIFGSLVKAIA